MKKIQLITLLLTRISGSSNAQDFELDPTFNADYNFYDVFNYDPIVFNIIESPDNKLYVSGKCYDTDFAYSNLTLLRFDSLGNFDQNFQPNNGFYYRMFDFKFQGDSLSSVGSKPYDHHAEFYKYDASGNIVNTTWSQNFHNSFYSTSNSFDAYLYDDGKILFTGEFRLDPSSSVVYDFVRINPNGLPDTTLMVDAYLGGHIFNFALYNENKLVVFGNWTNWLGDSISQHGLRRVELPSCELDASFQNIIENVVDSGFISHVYDIFVLDDGKIIIVGRFKLSGVDKIQGIARLNSNGSLDTTFNNSNNLSSDIYGSNIGNINTISLLHDNSSYLIGGYFKSYQGYERHCLVKTDLNGFIDPNSLNGLGVDTISEYLANGPTNHSSGVTQILPTKNGKYYIAGQIDGFNGTTTQPVFRIQPVTVGVEGNHNNAEIQLYPNPARETLLIHAGFVIEQIEIFNLSGALLITKKGNRKSATIDVSALPPGNYILRATCNDKVWLEKFMVMR